MSGSAALSEPMRPRDDVAQRVAGRLRLGDQPGVDDLADLGVVDRDQPQLAVDVAVDAGVADVEDRPVVGAPGRDDGQPRGGGAHAGLLGVLGDRLEDAARWPAASAATTSSRAGRRVRPARPAWPRRSARDLTGGVAAHAVGDHEDRPVGQEAVLVVLPHPPHVGRGAGAQRSGPDRAGPRWSPRDPHGLHELLERLVLDVHLSPPTEPVTWRRSTTWPRRAPANRWACTTSPTASSVHDTLTPTKGTASISSSKGLHLTVGAVSTYDLSSDSARPMVNSTERVKPRTTTLGANRPTVSSRRAAEEGAGHAHRRPAVGMSTVTDGGPGNCALGYFRVGIRTFRGNLRNRGLHREG